MLLKESSFKIPQKTDELTERVIRESMQPCYSQNWSLESTISPKLDNLEINFVCTGISVRNLRPDPATSKRKPSGGKKFKEGFNSNDTYLIDVQIHLKFGGYHK